VILKLKRKAHFLNTKKLWLDVHNYHVLHQWRLNNGLFIPHNYSDMNSESLSEWDDLGFIYAKRRIMVNWRHPRRVYADMLEDMVYDICSPQSPYKTPVTPKRGLYNRFARKREPLFLCSKKKYRKIGNSRKKYVGCETIVGDNEQSYFKKRNAVLVDLASADQGYVIPPAIKYERLYWCQRIDLIAPIEIRCEKDLLMLRDIAIAYLKGDTSQLMGMPEYTFADWSTDGSMLKVSVPFSHGVK
jgi:hypothetical protein